MKLFLIEQPADLKSVTPGKIYDGDLVPTIIDPITMEPVPPSYIIRYNDGNLICFKKMLLFLLQ